ncbi:hypothetical protein X941_5601 [Burkholderia pseudomallei MSHR5569]|nr:hypothetical protein X941_5601 [Burkholderia pseudomallei MSHR5569]
MASRHDGSRTRHAHRLILRIRARRAPAARDPGDRCKRRSASEARAARTCAARQCSSPLRGARRPARRYPAHASARTRQRDIASSATPFVRGPISPIDAITIAIAPAMNTNTPGVPNPFSTAAIANDVKIAEKRLHE